MAGQKNNRCCIKSAWGLAAPNAAGSFSRPDLAIPCQVAPQQSLTPFHQARASIHQGDLQRRFDNGCSIRSALLRIEIPPAEVNSRHALDAAATVDQHAPVYRVALSVRNSHQTNQHLSRRDRAPRGEREERPAKEWIGSNRIEKNDRNFPQLRRP
jgi:hypothetical protein